MMALGIPIPILLVEDDMIDAEDIRRCLKNNQTVGPVYRAVNGVDALNKLYGINGEEKLFPLPKIILLDINMPKMTGIEFLGHLRADPDLKSILVFVLTSSNSERDKVEAYNFNVAGYIVKPFEFSNFSQAMLVLNNYLSLLEYP